MDNLVGEQFGNYRLTKKLGGGGFGDVYLAENIYTHHLVAVKIPNEKVLRGAEELFFDEARTIAQFDHPHIARLLDFGVKGNTPYLIIEYAKQGSLRDHHQKGTQVNLATVIVYVKQIAEALQYAHDRKITHRDIKPENFLMKEEGEILLTDFGIAIDSYSWKHLLQLPAGSVYYMAPEQTHGKAGSASDQYSLAITVYEWLCGTVPFKGTRAGIERQHESVSPLPLHTYISIAPSVDEVILKALSKEPERRFQSVQAFATALEEAYWEQINVLLKQSEFTLDMLRGEYAQQMLLELIVKNPDWWMHSGQIKAKSLRMQVEQAVNIDGLAVLTTLSRKAVSRVIVTIARGEWDSCANLLQLIAEANPPTSNREVWSFLLERLSTDPQMLQAVIDKWAIASWLLEQWGKTSFLGGDKYLQLWFPTTWPAFWRFLKLSVSEEWYDRAFTNLLDATGTLPISSTIIRSIEQEHRSTVEGYIHRSFSVYQHRLTTVRFFAKLVESSYSGKMELFLVLLNTSDVPRNEGGNYATRLLTAARLTKEEITSFLEQHGSKLKIDYHLPIVSDYLKQYLLAFGPDDLDRLSARQFLQFLRSNSSVSFSKEILVLSENWSIIGTFIDQPVISRKQLTDLTSAIKQLPPTIHVPLLDKLSEVFISCINSEVDLILVMAMISTVLTESDLLRFLHRLAEIVGEKYKQKRSGTFLVPYIRIALQPETVFQDMSNTEQHEFMIKFLNTLLRYTDKETHKKLHAISQNWSPQLSVKWHDYETTHNFRFKKGPSQLGNISQFFRSPKVRASSRWSLFILLFSFLEVFYIALISRRASEWIFWVMLLLFNGVVGVLVGGKQNKWWRTGLLIFGVSTFGYWSTVLFSATIWKTWLPLWIVAIGPLPSLPLPFWALLMGVGIVGGVIGGILSNLVPVSLRTPALLGTVLPALVLLSTLVSILVYDSFVSPYPAYLPGHGSMALYDPLHYNGSSYGWDEHAYGVEDYCNFIGGAYSDDAPKGYHTPCYARSIDFSDFAFEVDMKIIKGDCGGIIFRADSRIDKYYLFRVCQDGSFVLFKYGDNDNATVLLTHDSTVIKQGLNQFNQLAIAAKGHTITLYVNSQKIGSVQDGGYTEGQIGLFADGPTNSTKVTFNNARTWII
jgi:serine/threonine protein kinase